MHCPACKREMLPLFTSCVCQYCDGLVEIDWHRGYIVFRGEEDFSRPVFVFPTRTEAAVYRQHNGWQMHPIREILFEHPVRWKPALGQLQGITLAARPFDLYRDHRFEPRPYAAFLPPLERAAA